MKAFKTFCLISSRTLTYVLDCVMPPFEEVRKLESMDIDTYIKALNMEINAKVAVVEKNPRKQIPNLKLDSNDSLVTLFPYRTHHMKTAIVEIKTHMNTKVVKLLAHAVYVKSENMFREFSSESNKNNLVQIPLLIPIPMTSKQRRKRGWNQCELVCKELELIAEKNNRQKLSGKLFQYEKNILTRVRETKDQVGMNKKERAENMKGSFEIKNPALIKGRDVIILDDVITTGSTLKESYLVAKKAGARKIILFSISY